MTVEDRLRNAVAPDEEGARARALARLRGEFEDGARAEERAGGALRAPVQRRWKGPLGGRASGRAGAPRAALGAALAVAVLAVVAFVTPPGEAVADWVRAAVGLRPQVHLPTDGTPRSDRPPSGGRLLVAAGGSLWVVEASGARHRLGAWTAASWSPHGRFVVAWKGRRLAALDRRGRVQWSLTAARPITNAEWSPSGFRISYREGQDLRLVAGDGTGDRLLDAGTFRATAWRPGPGHVLAWNSGAHVDIADVDRGRRLARIRLPHVPGGIAWSADGSRLFINLHHSIAVYDARGRRTARFRMPRHQLITTFVPARSGNRVAVSRHEHVASEVALVGGGHDDVLFRGDARFTRLAFSPDGRWLLAAWPLPDQWVFLRVGTSGPSRVITSAGVSRRFHVRGFPQLEGWCCPP